MRNIRAVAKNTIRQAFRLKIAYVFLAVLVVLLPLMAWTMTGDGTVKGKLQTFVSYGLSLTGFLLAIFTIVVSIYTLTSDLQQRQIFMVITKPIRRFELILGKLFGVILLDAFLLLVLSAVIYGLALAIPKFGHVTQEQQAQLDNEFFTARASLKPIIPDVTEEVKQTYEKLEKSGQLSMNMTKQQILNQLQKQKELEKRAVPVGYDILWEFNNLKPIDPRKSLFIRFKYDVSINPPDLQLYSKWLVGDIRQIQYGTAMINPVFEFNRKDLIRTFYEIEVPASAVAADGYLGIAFINIPLNNTVVIFPPEDGLEVLYKTDSFTANFFRAAILIFLRLIFLAALGTLAASFLSFPVAILLCLMIFFTATVSGFVIESFDYLGQNATGIYNYTVKPLIQLIPQFDKYNPASYIVSARLIGWPLLGKVVLLMLCLQSMVPLIGAVIIFHFKEIARITV
ncbi:MAG: hypothetical protein PHF37_06795 [Phycisphaerae bacterium]|nr:hypothetical protein [Phycisphaerae bacterium]